MTATESLTWYGLSALAIESEVLRIVVVPELGAKIVSLFDKCGQREWLVGPVQQPKPIGYGMRFVDQDMSGWDESFPTIEPCKYPGDGKYFGRSLPDHGEVWAVPWRRENNPPNTLTFSVQGTALPYKLLRTISFSAPDILRLDYSVTNTGTEAINYLWAAHPQFVADDETRIVLPPHVEKVLNVRAGSRWGGVGEYYQWPQGIAADEKPYSLNQLGFAALHPCRKFYLPPEVQIDWAMLADYGSGRALRLNWFPMELPYLGIWIDEGVYSIAPVISLEPTTGFYDSLATASENGRVAYLAPGEARHWSLSVQILGMD